MNNFNKELKPIISTLAGLSGLALTVYCCVAYIKEVAIKTDNKFEEFKKAENIVKLYKIKKAKLEQEVELIKNANEKFKLLIGLIPYLKKTVEDTIAEIRVDLSKGTLSDAYKDSSDGAKILIAALDKKKPYLLLDIIARAYKAHVELAKPRLMQEIKQTIRELEEPTNPKKLHDLGDRLGDSIDKIAFGVEELSKANSAEVSECIEFLVEELVILLSDIGIKIDFSSRDIVRQLEDLLSKSWGKIEELKNRFAQDLQNNKEQISELLKNIQESKDTAEYGTLVRCFSEELYNGRPEVVDCYKSNIGNYYAYCLDGTKIPLFIFQEGRDDQGNKIVKYIVPGTKVSSHKNFMPFLKQHFADLKSQTSTLVVEFLQKKGLVFNLCSKMVSLAEDVGLGELFNANLKDNLSKQFCANSNPTLDKFFDTNAFYKTAKDISLGLGMLLTNFYSCKDLVIDGANFHSTIGIVRPPHIEAKPKSAESSAAKIFMASRNKASSLFALGDEKRPASPFAQNESSPNHLNKQALSSLNSEKILSNLGQFDPEILKANFELNPCAWTGHWVGCSEIVGNSVSYDIGFSQPAY